MGGGIIITSPAKSAAVTCSCKMAEKAVVHVEVEDEYYEDSEDYEEEEEEEEEDEPMATSPSAIKNQPRASNPDPPKASNSDPPIASNPAPPRAPAPQDVSAL